MAVWTLGKLYLGGQVADQITHDGYGQEKVEGRGGQHGLYDLRNWAGGVAVEQHDTLSQMIRQGIKNEN